MYVPLNEIVQQYGIICKDSLSHTTCKLVIFVSCLNIDALCAAKMLSQLLKSDLIPHKIVPIAGFDELREAYATIADDAEITTVVMAGCGATIDLLAYLDVDKDATNKKFYIADNHRPWNLENLFATDRVVCFYDEETDEESQVEKLKDAYINLLRLYEEQDQDGSDSEDEDSARRGRHDEDEDEIELEDEEPTSRRREDDDGDDPRPTRHIDRVRKARQLEARIGKYEHTLESHYTKGTYVSTSTATTIYALLSDLGMTTVSTLWPAIVGATSLDAQHPHIYQIIYPALRTEVLRLNPRSAIIDTEAMRRADPAAAAAAAAAASTPAQQNSGDDDSLYPEPDYLFFLLRHWSLYDSMTHSSYISAKLRLYLESGRRRLKTMLAKMGISLHDACEQWTHTNVTVKKTLLQKLHNVAESYNIRDVIREGIVRRFGFKGALTAGDCVDALITLLQVGHLVNAANCQTVPVLGGGEANGQAAGEDAEEVETRERFWVPNFWNAWDAMDKVDKLMEGINRAKMIQENIVVAATQLFEKRQIKNLRSYRLAVIQDGPDLELFANPLALTRLALWISDACAEAIEESLPLIVASYYKPSDTYLVLGMGPRRSREENDRRMAERSKRKKKSAKKTAKAKNGSSNDDSGTKKRKSKANGDAGDSDDGFDDSGGEEDEDEDDSDDEENNEKGDEDKEEAGEDEDDFNRYNAFGTAFYKVAEQIKARVKLDSFESAVIEVSREELSRFLEALTTFGLLRRH